MIALFAIRAVDLRAVIPLNRSQTCIWDGKTRTSWYLAVFSGCWLFIWSSENQINLSMKWALPSPDSIGGLWALCRSRTYTSDIAMCPVVSVCNQSCTTQWPGIPQPYEAMAWHRWGQGFCPTGWAELRYLWQCAGSVPFLEAALVAHLFFVFKTLLVLFIMYCYYL